MKAFQGLLLALEPHAPDGAELSMFAMTRACPTSRVVLNILFSCHYRSPELFCAWFLAIIWGNIIYALSSFVTQVKPCRL